MNVLAFLLTILVACLALIFIVVPLFKGLGWMISRFFVGIGWVVAHVFRFLIGMVSDTLRAVGAVIMSVIFVPLVILNVVIGHWSAAAHFGRCVQDEIRALAHSVYRVVIGHPARFLLLHPLTEGLEQRLPQAMAHAPGRDRPSKATGAFQGYTIVGSLKGGGSGGRLYIAEPDETKLAAFARNGQPDIDQVVIKSFSLKDGSSLPQIIRESRALEAAKKLGFVLEHDQTADRFYYVMPYVPGDSLTAITQRLHIEAGPQGLRHAQVSRAVSLISDLLLTLDHYHRGGLWHKDIKPDNIIVGPDGRANLVDLGLITPLRSAMTLTTHGTEYFRDPELVRMALRGVKVHEVDGVKFDIYGAGAVLYSVIENSFPAHGGLSQIEKNCPEALRWIVRRAMTDLNKRYGSAAEMLADLRVVAAAADPFLLRPADLPSVQGTPIEEPARQPVMQPVAHAAHARAGSPLPPPIPRRAATDAAQPANPNDAPRLRVLNWFTGGYLIDPQTATTPAAPPPIPAPAAGAARPARRAPAPEQLHQARQRVRGAQQRARTRMRTGKARFQGPDRNRYNNNPNLGVGIAAVIFLLGIGGVVALVMSHRIEPMPTPHLVAGDAAPFSFPLVHVLHDGVEAGVFEYTSDDAASVTVASVPSRGRVLVVNHGDVDAPGIRWLLSRLSTLGYETFGNGDSDEEIDLQASILHDALKGYAVDAPEADEMLRRWMVRTDADFDYALVVPPHADDQVRLVRGGGTTTDQVEALLSDLDHAN